MNNLSKRVGCHYERGINKLKTTVVAIGCLPLMFVGMGTASANLVSNPSFETFAGTFGSDGGRQLTTGVATLTGWAITGGEIAILKNPNSYNLTPSEGNNFLDIAGYSNAGFPKGITQTLTGLTDGQTYALSMDLGIRNGACVGSGGCTGPIQVTASVGGTSQTFTHNSTEPGNIWGTYGFNFTAVSPSMTLSLVGDSLPRGNQYIGLDNISVSAVPMPAAVWLFGSGLITLLGVPGIRRNLF